MTETARRILAETRRSRQQDAAQAYGEFLRRRTAQEIEEDRLLIESGNDIALRGSTW